MNESIRSILTGLSAVNILVLIALFLTFTRSLRAEEPIRLRAMIDLFLIGIACQCLHMVEEYATGFYIHFPQLLGLTPWSSGFFVAFNLCWIGIWALSGVGVGRNYRIALFPVWFLALASVANMIGHPLMALAQGRYFPGLFTSPLVGIIGILLIKRLSQLTA